MKTIIDFNRFAYYEVVKCNRQKIGLHKSAQGGVEDYNSWGCGDAADLNAGYLALAAIGGLALGIVGTTAVMLPKLRKKKAEVAG